MGFPRPVRPLALATLALACGRPTPPTATLTATALRGPADSLIPSGPLGASIRRGRALLAATRESLPDHVGNGLRCVSCHLDAGRRQSGSWVGVYARYPQYRPRSATVETIEYRVNDCFRRSMNGAPLATDGPDMRDVVAYLWFLSRGVPIAPPAPPAPPAPSQGGDRLRKWAGLKSDTLAGAAGVAGAGRECPRPAGPGPGVRPPGWGPQS